MVHRCVSSVRNARRTAMSPLYSGLCSPRSSPQRRPLRDLGNAQHENNENNTPPDSSALDQAFSDARNADREHQRLALQELSRRQRRVPNENHVTSPTPGPSRPRVQPPQVRLFIDVPRLLPMQIIL